MRAMTAAALALGALALATVTATTAAAAPACPTPAAHYKSGAEMEAFADALQRDYPTLVRRVSLGRSGEGRDMVGVLISDAPDAPRAPLEPEFKYVANIHGDETVGRELLAQFACLLLANYAAPPAQRNATLAAFVDDTRTYLFFTMNPDGYARMRRGNARGVDLNRNFPDHVKDRHIGCDAHGVVAAPPPPPQQQQLASRSAAVRQRRPRPREAETCAVIKWLGAHQVVLGGHFHGGALVVSYGLDGRKDGRGGAGVYVRSPEERFLHLASHLYADHNAAIRDGQESPMYGAERGIVNGAYWYSIYGGVQDYHYYWHDAIDVTFEVSGEYERDKHPPPATLPGYWAANRESMIFFAQQVHRGVRGVVRSGCAPAPHPPLVGARYTATNTRDADDPVHEMTMHSMPPHGDYFRLLTPGAYALRFDADGHRAVTVKVEVSFGTGRAAVRTVNVLLPCATATAAAAAAAAPPLRHTET